MNKQSQGETARMVVPSDLIDVQTVADLLCLDRSTVTRRAKAGTLPVLVQMPSGFYIFDVNEIRALAAAA